MLRLSTIFSILLVRHTFAVSLRRCYACDAQSLNGPEEPLCIPTAPNLAVVNCTSNCSLLDTRVFGFLVRRHMGCDPACTNTTVMVDAHHQEVKSCCTEDLCNRPHVSSSATTATPLSSSQATTLSKTRSSATVTFTVTTETADTTTAEVISTQTTTTADRTTQAETATVGSCLILRPSMVLMLFLCIGYSLFR